MENNLQIPIPRLLTLGGDVANGFDEHGATLGITRNTATVIRADVAAADTANINYELGAQALRTLNGELVTLCAEAWDFGFQARDLLKPTLGRRRSAAWNQLGMGSSLRIPTKREDLQALMQALKTFFANNPTLQVEGRGLTSERAGELFTNISNKRAVILIQQTAVKNLMIMRDEKAAALRQRIRLFIAELAENIGPTDPHWLSFGLNMPGAKERPATPQNVTAVLIGPNAISVKWSAAARAERYRVWKRIVGQEPELLPAGTAGDLDMILENLPPNSLIEIAVSAVNSGGESAKSVIIPVMTT